MLWSCPITTSRLAAAAHSRSIDLQNLHQDVHLDKAEPLGGLIPLLTGLY